MAEKVKHKEIPPNVKPQVCLTHGCHHGTQEPSLRNALTTWSPSPGPGPEPAHPVSHWALALCAVSSDWSLFCNPSGPQMVLMFSPGWEPNESHGQLLIG